MNFTSANWKFILKLYIYLHEVKQRQEIQFNLYKSSSKASDRKEIGRASCRERV